MYRSSSLFYLLSSAEVSDLCHDNFSTVDEEKLSDVATAASQQQSDWTPVWECFDKPHILFNEGAAKSMQEVVKGAVAEMRRYYSKKIVDVLVKVTRSSLEALRKRFSVECKCINKLIYMYIYVVA